MDIDLDSEVQSLRLLQQLQQHAAAKDQHVRDLLRTISKLEAAGDQAEHAAKRTKLEHEATVIDLRSAAKRAEADHHAIVTDLEQRNMTLEQTCKRHADDAASLGAQCSQQQVALAAAAAEMDTISRRVTELQGAAEQHRVSEADATQMLRTARSHIDRADERHAAREVELSQERSRRAKAETARATLEAELESERCLRAEKQKTHESELRELQDRLTERRRELDDLSAAAAPTKAALDASSDHGKALTRDLERIRGEREALAESCQDAGSLLSQWREALDRAREAATSATLTPHRHVQPSSKHVVSESIQDPPAPVLLPRLPMTGAGAILAPVWTEISHLQRACAEERLRSQSSQLQLTTLRSECETMRQALKTAELHARDLNEKWEDAESRRGVAARRCEAESARLSELIAANELAKTQAAEREGDLTSCRREQEAMQTKVSNLEAQLEQRGHDLLERGGQIATKEGLLAIQEKKIHKFAQEVPLLRSRLMSAESAIRAAWHSMAGVGVVGTFQSQKRLRDRTPGTKGYEEEEEDKDGNPFQSPASKGNPYTPTLFAERMGVENSEVATPNSTTNGEQSALGHDDGESYSNSDAAAATLTEDPPSLDALLSSFSFGIGELVGNHTMLQTHRSIDRSEADTVGESHRKVEAHLVESRDSALRQLNEVQEKLEAQLAAQQLRYDEAQRKALKHIMRLEQKHASELADAVKRFEAEHEKAQLAEEDREAKVRSELQVEHSEAMSELRNHVAELAAARDASEAELSEAKTAHEAEIEDLRSRYEDHVTEIASASKTVEAAILEARRRAKLEVTEVRETLSAENQEVRDALGSRLADAQVVIEQLAREKTQFFTAHRDCSSQLQSAKHALLLLARGAAPLLLRCRELVVQKAVLTRQLRHHEQVVEGLSRVAGSVHIGIADDSTSANGLADSMLLLPKNDVSDGESDGATPYESNTTTTTKVKPSGVRHIPALRTVAMAVIAAVRLRRTTSCGSWFGVVDEGGSRIDTHEDGGQRRARTTPPTSLIRAGDLPDPDPVLPPLNLLVNGPEGELFEVLVERLTGLRARWSEDIALRGDLDRRADERLPLLEALAEGTVPHAVRLAERGVSPPRTVATSEALQVSRALDDGSCNRVTLARWKRAAERGVTGHALAASIESGLVALAQRVVQGNAELRESWTTIQELENARTLADAEQQQASKNQEVQLAEQTQMISLLSTAKNEANLELMNERKKGQATAKALHELRSAPVAEEQVTLHHEESKQRDELRTALEKAAAHFGH